MRKQLIPFYEARGRTIDADADIVVNRNRCIAEIAGVTPLDIKAMILVAIVGLDVQCNDGFTPHNLKTVIETGMSVKAIVIKSLIIAFDRVALGTRSEYIVVASSSHNMW